MSSNLSSFKAYDIRGIYPTEINPEIVYRIAWAFGKYLKTELKKSLPFSVVLGQDMRGSSPFLARSVLQGLTDQGIDVIELGRVPTPAFYYTIGFKDYAGGIMITASHNPKEYNGLKLCGEKGFPIGQATGLEKIKAFVEREAPTKSATKGKFLSLPNVTAEYVKQDLSYLNFGKIQRLKIAADPANAMGAVYLEELFKLIPCELIKLNWELNGNFPVHEANPLKVETLQQLQAVIKNEQADFGIATDGDGDRLGFVDEQGQLIRGDIITAILAKILLAKYPGAKIGYEVRSSRMVQETIKQNGGLPVLMPAGYALMKPIMEKEQVLFAGESSMHYMFRENYNNESPVFVIAQLLLLRSVSDRPFSELCRPYLKYFHSGELNFQIEDKAGVIEKLEKNYQDGKISKLDGLTVEYDDWWFNLRPSNTEPLLRLNLEAKDEETMKKKGEEVSKLIVGS